MTIQTLPLGAFQANCYLVSDENGVTALIDPGAQPEKICSALGESTRAVKAILLTHGHFDHIGAVQTLAKKFSCPVYVHETELLLPRKLTKGELYYTDFYRDGDTVAVGDLRFTVLHTPGHSPGSVCLRCADKLFTGDTLFSGSCGRIDFSGGNARKMQESLARLAAIEDNLAVLPGHGEKTTLSIERASNPYLRRDWL